MTSTADQQPGAQEPDTPESGAQEPGAQEPGAQEPGTPEPAGEGSAVRVGTVALVVGVMALVSSWTGWGGIVLGLAAVVVALVGLARARSGRASGTQPARRPLAGLALGVVALVVGMALEWTTITSGVTYLHSSQPRTLDECMRQAVNEKEQHVCKSQHLDEYRARFPGRIDP